MSAAVTIEQGIQRFSWGYRARVQVGDLKPAIQSFPLDTELKDIREWRESERKRLRKEWKDAQHETAATAPIPGTIEQAIVAYSPQIANWPKADQRARLKMLATWMEKLGGRHRAMATIAAPEISIALKAWRGIWGEGHCNNYRTALMTLFVSVYGKSGINPVRDVPPFPMPDSLPRGRDRYVVDKLIQQAPPSRCRTACWVINWTGMRPAELRKAEPDDLDLRLGFVIARTGKRGRTRTIPLTRQARAAWQAFDREDLWGRVPKGNALLKWVGRWLRPRLPSMRTYDLRHTYGTACALEGGSDTQIAELMGHSSTRHVRRYTLAALKAGALQLTRKLERGRRRLDTRSRPQKVVNG